jgi:hypothetical protein
MQTNIRHINKDPPPMNAFLRIFYWLILVIVIVCILALLGHKIVEAFTHSRYSVEKFGMLTTVTSDYDYVKNFIKSSLPKTT